MSGNKVRAGVGAAVALAAAMAMGGEYQDEWGPAAGTEMPAIAAADQHGELRSLDDLKGEHGMLLFMVRSADW